MQAAKTVRGKTKHSNEKQHETCSRHSNIVQSCKVQITKKKLERDETERIGKGQTLQ